MDHTDGTDGTDDTSTVAAVALRVTALDHLVINVADVERALAFYGGLLGLEPLRVDEWRAGEAPFPSVRVDAGTIIDLMALPRDGQNVDHVCLVVEPDDLRTVLDSGRFDVKLGPVPRWGARGIASSVYVCDPDGNTVELRSYDPAPVDAT